MRGNERRWRPSRRDDRRVRRPGRSVVVAALLLVAAVATAAAPAASAAPPAPPASPAPAAPVPEAPPPDARHDRPDLDPGAPPPVPPITGADASVDGPRATLGAEASSATFGRAPAAWRDAPDPSVLLVAGRYVAYTTNANGLNIQVLTSLDLVHWTVAGEGLPARGAWASNAPGMVWAPDVLETGRTFVLYYTAPDRASGRQCIGTAVSASPLGPFVDPSPQPLVCEAAQGGSIDPSVFEHDGVRYLQWKTDGNAIDQPSRLWSQRLAVGGRSVEGPRSQLLVSGAAWEQGIIEGPSMVADGGRYLLLYSGGRWWEGDYGIGYATCNSPLGPCTKRTTTEPWARNSAWSLGSGGADVVRDPLGNLWMAYHGWTGAVGYDRGGSRSLFIERLTVDGGVPTARNDLQRGGPFDPFGDLDAIRSPAPGRVVVSGWAIDLDHGASGPSVPVGVHVYLDGRFVAAVATGTARSDTAAAFPGHDAAGFVASVAVAPGRRTLCAYAINVGMGSTNQNLGCATFDAVAPRYGPVATTNADGRLEVFAMDALGGLVHAWQVTAGGAWSEWESLGLVASAAPVVARNGDGRLEIVAVDAGGWLVHRWQVIGQGWSPWRSFGIAATGTAAVGTNVDGRLELFARRPDGRLVHGWQSPPHGWSAFVDSGASASSSPELHASADGRLEVFVTSGDGGLLHSWQTRRNGSFSPWRYTGTFAQGMPDVERSVDGRLELFAVDRRGEVVHSWQVVANGAWSGWAPLGFRALERVVATRNADGRLEAFGIAPNLGLFHAWQDPRSVTGWSGWHPMGLPVYTQPSAALNADGRMALVALDASGRLLQASQVPGVGWSGWRPITPGSP